MWKKVIWELVVFCIVFELVEKERKIYTNSRKSKKKRV